jgi:hypothetical protein
MPPEPPKRARPGSSSDLRHIVDEQPERLSVNHPGVDGVAQPVPRKSTLVGMGTVRPSGEFQPTLPAPNPLRYQTAQRPAPPSTVALARRTDPPAGSAATPTGIRVPSDETRSDKPPGASLPPASLSPEAATVAALRRRAEAAEADKAEALRQLRIQLEAKAGGPYQKPIESVRPAPATKPATADDEPSPRAWKAALFKVVVGLGAVLTATATILGVRATAIEPKVDKNTVRTNVVEVAQDTLTERVAKLEAFARADSKRHQCVEAQLRDALARGTGHVITTLPADPTGWSEQNAPKNEPRLYWKSPTWFTVQGCDAAPAPP